MRSEESGLQLGNMKAVKEVGRKIPLEIKGIKIYTKRLDKEGKRVKQFLVLTLHSSVMLNIRWNLNLVRDPPALVLHISVFERFLNYD